MSKFKQHFRRIGIDPRPAGPESKNWTGTVERVSAAIGSALKVALLAAAFTWAVIEHEFLKDWLSSLTHAEWLGVKIDREAVDEATAALKELVKSQKASGIEQEIGEAAIRRSARVAPAIVGSRILWVDDDHPENNKLERDILKKLKIDVSAVKSTAEALRALRRGVYDIIISDVRRTKDPSGLLDRCRLHYFDYPNDELKKKYEANGGLAAFNADQNLTGPAGFSMIEGLVPEDGTMSPRVIFYSGRNADIVRSLCGDKITNRGDILLQTVVSMLEELHWDRLPKRN
jgi:CheY-like chemotaxis protein